MEISMLHAPTIGEVRYHEHRRRAFREAIQPWVDLKLYIMGVALPSIVIGENFYRCSYPPDIQEWLGWCDAHIEDAARRFGFLI